jgi:beta-lactamase superfamily II metal-dependent hydrolase
VIVDGIMLIMGSFVTQGERNKISYKMINILTKRSWRYNDMKVHIFDVEHGNCCAIEFSSGECMMIDCGHNSSTGWRPSRWVLSRGGELTNLTISNFDEDHVSDLPDLYNNCHIKSLSKNWYVDSDWIRREKAQNGMGPGISTLVNMIDYYTDPSLNTDWGGSIVKRFCFSPNVLNDVNSLSLVTFIHYMGIRIVFPGDMTSKGWSVLLQNNDFRTMLQNTNIFVASHHGRIDGYCSDVFEYCTPDIIIISDKSIRYETQNVDYSKHARGIRWNNTEIRKVLTTRNDGKLEIELSGSNGYYITSFA